MINQRWRTWTEQRHDTEGRDVTDLPGLWATGVNCETVEGE